MSMLTDSIVFFVKPFPLGSSKEQQNPLSNIRHKDFHLSFVLLFVFVAQHCCLVVHINVLQQLNI